MKTYLADIIPRIQKYSKKLDDVTLLTNHNWVAIGDIENNRTVYSFDKDGELDIFENGIGIDNGNWKFKADNSLKISLKNGPTMLLQHGFIEEHIMALKLDGTDSYAFFVNEGKYQSELNKIDVILKFLEDQYLKPDLKIKVNKQRPSISKGRLSKCTTTSYKTQQGTLTLTEEFVSLGKKIVKATLDGKIAPDGVYKLGMMWYVIVKNGIVKK